MGWEGPKYGLECKKVQEGLGSDGLESLSGEVGVCRNAGGETERWSGVKWDT